uniref:Uncharacterized protein n=1 Tax=Oryza barthii TaxID=65489 RepID=A0A0D3FXL9_9ORYZ
MAAMVEGHHPADGASSAAARGRRSPGAGVPSTAGTNVGGGLGQIAERTMLLTDDDPSCADWWCGFGQGIAGESLAEPFGWLTTVTPFGVVPFLGGVVKTLLRFRTSGDGDPRRILLGGTALEKPLRIRILSLVYALASNFSPRP